MPLYEIKKGEPVKRISCLSAFQTGIKPMWEDEANAQGSEYKITLQNAAPGQGNFYEKPYESINKIWHDLLLDIATERFPHLSDVAGVCMRDKSRDGHLNVRMEVCFKFADAAKDERCKSIKAFIQKEYLEVNQLATSGSEQFKADNHKKH